MNVLVSIVSDQPIPNLEFIKLKTGEADSYLFISSAKMEEKGVRKWILDTLNLPTEKIAEPIIVDAMDFQNIEETLQSKLNDEDRYIVNLTGGTKLQSLAAYNLFRNLNSELYYLTGTGHYIKIHPGTKKQKYTLGISISLQEYLTAHGFSVLKQSTPHFPFQENEKLLNLFLNKGIEQSSKLAFDDLRNYRKKGLKEFSDPVAELIGLLKKEGISFHSDGSLTVDEVKSLSGEWFEDYVYQFIAKEFKVSSDSLGLGYIIKKGEPRNEFDVLIIWKNKLILIECKTSVFTDEEQKKTFIQDVIYKSDSLQKQFGLFATTIIATLSDLSSPNMKNHLQRAQENRITIIERKDFESGNLSKALKEILK